MAISNCIEIGYLKSRAQRRNYSEIQKHFQLNDDIYYITLYLLHCIETCECSQTSDYLKMHSPGVKGLDSSNCIIPFITLSGTTKASKDIRKTVILQMSQHTHARKHSQRANKQNYYLTINTADGVVHTFINSPLMAKCHTYTHTNIQ